jgi:hypothetical protein
LIFKLSPGSSSLPFMMRVMGLPFVSVTDKVMARLVLVVSPLTGCCGVFSALS